MPNGQATTDKGSVAGQEAHPGICGTCIHAPACVHRLQNPGVTIWECDLFDSFEAPNLLEAVQNHVGKQGAVIAMLQEIQGRYGYLPPRALEIVAKKTGTKLVDIYSVATFYRAFSLEPRGKHLISVCLGTACHVRGGPGIAHECSNHLKVKPGETTSDREFTMETVNCLGACALGPVVVADGRYFPKVAPGQVKDIVTQARGGFHRPELSTDERVFPVQVNCPRCNHSLMDPRHLIDGHPSIRVTVACGREHGWMRLSSLYGSYEVETEHAVPIDSIILFFCPHCHTELRSPTICPECAAPMVPLMVRGGGVVQICARRGCKGHMLDVAGGVL